PEPLVGGGDSPSSKWRTTGGRLFPAKSKRRRTPLHLHQSAGALTIYTRPKTSCMLRYLPTVYSGIFLMVRAFRLQGHECSSRCRPAGHACEKPNTNDLHAPRGVTGPATWQAAATRISGARDRRIHLADGADDVVRLARRVSGVD